MDLPPPPRRGRGCCSWLSWVLALIATIIIVLVSVCAAFLLRTNAHAQPPKPIIDSDRKDDNIVVVFNGQTINLGQQTRYNFAKQARLLKELMDHPEQGLEGWYLQSSVRGEDTPQRKTGRRKL